MDINFTRLRYFSVVARLGSVRRASEALHIAQPALSRHIQILEEDIGVALLTRSSRGVVPTQAGALLVQGADTLTEHAAQVLANVRAEAITPRGVVRVGALPSVAARAMPDIISDCRARFPEVTFSLSQGYTPQLRDMLLADRLDLAILTDAGSHPDMLVEPLYRENMWLVTGGRKDWGAARSVPLSTLMDRPLVVSRFLRQELEKALPPGSLRIVVELDSAAPTLELVRGGRGDYYGPPSVLWPDLEAGSLAGVKVDGMQSLRMLARRHDRPSTMAITSVADAIRQFIGRKIRSKTSPLVAPGKARTMRRGAQVKPALATRPTGHERLRTR
jgi:LysR family nitrogen assimilation transcriptional regulator